MSLPAAHKKQALEGKGWRGLGRREITIKVERNQSQRLANSAVWRYWRSRLRGRSSCATATIWSNDNRISPSWLTCLPRYNSLSLFLSIYPFYGKRQHYYNSLRVINRLVAERIQREGSDNSSRYHLSTIHRLDGCCLVATKAFIDQMDPLSTSLQPFDRPLGDRLIFICLGSYSNRIQIMTSNRTASSKWFQLEDSPVYWGLNTTYFDDDRC